MKHFDFCAVLPPETEISSLVFVLRVINSANEKWTVEECFQHLNTVYITRNIFVHTVRAVFLVYCEMNKFILGLDDTLPVQRVMKSFG